MKRKFDIKFPGSKESKTMTVFSNEKAEYDGKEFEFDYELLSENVVLMRIEGKNHIVRLESNEETDYDLISNASKYKVSCKSELDVIKEKYIGSDKSRFKDKVVSPMPGAVVKINVSEGMEVNSGDVLLVLEAMKMENEIKVSSDCIVKSIHIKEKNSVDKGQLLITLEEKPN
jgi:biotin carboxyl carrier protein